MPANTLPRRRNARERNHPHAGHPKGTCFIHASPKPHSKPSSKRSDPAGTP